MLSPLTLGLCSDGSGSLVDKTDTMETHGHDPIARTNQGMTSNPRSWIDEAVSLPAGQLVKFILYSHDVIGKRGLVLEPRFFWFSITVMVRC